MVAHAFNFRRQRQVDLCEFKDNLVYRASSRTGSKATEKPSHKKPKNNTTTKNDKQDIKINNTGMVFDPKNDYTLISRVFHNRAWKMAWSLTCLSHKLEDLSPDTQGLYEEAWYDSMNL